MGERARERKRQTDRPGLPRCSAAFQTKTRAGAAHTHTHIVVRYNERGNRSCRLHVIWRNPDGSPSTCYKAPHARTHTHTQDRTHTHALSTVARPLYLGSPGRASRLPDTQIKPKQSYEFDQRQTRKSSPNSLLPIPHRRRM